MIEKLRARAPRARARMVVRGGLHRRLRGARAPSRATRPVPAPIARVRGADVPVPGPRRRDSCHPPRIRPAAAAGRRGSVLHAIVLDPGTRVELAVTVTASVDPAPRAYLLGWDDAAARRRAVVEDLRRDVTRIETDHNASTPWAERARSDLYMLLTRTTDGFVAYAGVPWFVAPFGRDSLSRPCSSFRTTRGRGRHAAVPRRVAGHAGRRTSRTRSRARSFTSTGAARWPTAARSRSSRTTGAWMPRLSSWCSWPSTSAGRDVRLARVALAGRRSGARSSGTGRVRGRLSRVHGQLPAGLVHQGWKDS